METSSYPNGLVKCGMGKVPRRVLRPIFLDEWLTRTGRDRAGAAKAADVDISYINNMIGGRKMNPSAHVMLGISDYLGITVNDLYHKPPPDSHISSLGELSPGARDALLNARKPRS